LPKFSDWFRSEVAAALEGGIPVAEDVFEASHLPEQIAIGYRAMYAYGMHLWKRYAVEDKVTYDFGIVASVWRQERPSTRIPSPILSEHEYVGTVEEILELDYPIPLRRCTGLLLDFSWT
jgi:hypothetical protein